MTKSTSWTIRWGSERGGAESVTTDRLERAQETVLDLVRRGVDFRVTVSRAVRPA